MMTDRLRRLNMIVLMVVVVYTIVMVKLVSRRPLVNPSVDGMIVLLTSIGFYHILIELLLQVVCNVRFFLRLYWGKLFLDGLWSYAYTVDGRDNNDDKIYFGVWRFEQTLYNTCVVGFGLTDTFIVRSRVRSMTDMIKNGNMYEFINIRTDSLDPAIENYSRTSMYFELNKKRFFRYPVRMRGMTIVYGGPLSGRVYNNVFVRHESARTEEDVIEELRQKYGEQPSLSRLTEPGDKSTLEEGSRQTQIVGDSH